MAQNETSADTTTAISNPINWYCARDEDAEFWHLAGEQREDAIAKGRADYPDEPFWIAKANRMVPSFALFDADDLFERLNEDECWWEDGWTGEPGPDAARELEARLVATFRQWFAEHASLSGAALDEISSEQIIPAAPEPQS